MKKICLFVFISIAFILYAGAQQPATVKGIAPDYWQEGTELVVSELTGAKEFMTQIVVKDRKFEFSFPIKEPLFFYVCSRNGMGLFNLMLAPGEQVSINYADGKMEVEGAALQKEMEEKITGVFDAQNKRRNELWKEYKDIILATQASQNDEDSQKSEEYKTYLDKSADLELAFQEEMNAWALQHASTIWAPLAMLYNPSCKPSRELYEALSPEIKASFYGEKIREQLDAMLVGKPAPDFTLKDAEGKAYTLKQLLEGNQYLLVDFWASWCGPCRKGIPEVKEFAKKYAGKGLAVLSISIDTDRNAWLKALEEEQMPWINLLDDAGVSKQYGVKGIPSVFLLKADGTVLFEKLYGEAIGRELKKVLGE